MIVIIPDTAPLIHLAAAGLLELLPALGRVVVPDVIAMETTRLPDKPYAGVVGDWLESGAPETVPTEIGALYRIAIEQGIKPPRNSGELAIIEWLHDRLEEPAVPVAVIYEDRRFPAMVAGEQLAAAVTMLTTRSFLDLAAERGIIPSAEAAWERIIARAPTASPFSTRTTLKPFP